MRMASDIGRAIAVSTMVVGIGGCSGIGFPSHGQSVSREPLAAPPFPAVTAADIRIAELQDRIARLERRIATLTRLDGIVGGSLPIAPGISQCAPQLAQVGSGGPAPAGPPVGDTDEVSDEELSRALSRTLVEQGGLVLPPYSVEVTPEIVYAHRSTSGLQLFTSGGVPTVGAVDTRQDTVTAALTGRVGLPYSSQVELQVPYAYDRLRVNRLNQDETVSGNGLGDVQLTVSKQLLRERGAVPDLLAFLGWTAPTGDAELGSGDPSLGSGHHSLRAGLTAVKSQDPLVYFGSLSYDKNFSDTVSGRDLDSGDTINLRAGTILAVSPQTSLRTIFESKFNRSTQVDGVKVPGSDDVAASLEFGVATVLTDRMLLDVTAGFGVTDAAPDFRFGVALPYRF